MLSGRPAVAPRVLTGAHTHTHASTRGEESAWHSGCTGETIHALTCGARTHTRALGTTDRARHQYCSRPPLPSARELCHGNGASQRSDHGEGRRCSSGARPSERDAGAGEESHSSSQRPALCHGWNERRLRAGGRHAAARRTPRDGESFPESRPTETRTHRHTVCVQSPRQAPVLLEAASEKPRPTPDRQPGARTTTRQRPRTTGRQWLSVSVSPSLFSLCVWCSQQLTRCRAAPAHLWQFLPDDKPHTHQVESVDPGPSL